MHLTGRKKAKLVFQNYFQQNKDWNSATSIWKSTEGIFQNYFQQNKDWN